MVSATNVFSAVLCLLCLFVVIRGIKQGRFDSVYGEKLSLRRRHEPIAFWSQALIIVATAALFAGGTFL